jgi:hypothetical protein
MGTGVCRPGSSFINLLKVSIAAMEAPVDDKNCGAIMHLNKTYCTREERWQIEKCV